MTHHELETLINSTNFTDDIDRNLFLMAMAEHDAEIDAAREKEYKYPDWINLARGFSMQGDLPEASPAIIKEAKKLHYEFLRFKCAKAETFQELVEAFTLAKAQNRVIVQDVKCDDCGVSQHPRDMYQYNSEGIKCDDCFISWHGHIKITK
jgi:hypothetical protein